MTRSDLKRGSNENFIDYLTRMSSIVTEYETLSEGHVRWFTHKNPYGCWICDVFELLRTVVTEVDEVERDFMTQIESESESNILPSPQATNSIKDEEQSES